LGRHECQALVTSELLECTVPFHVASSMPQDGKGTTPTLCDVWPHAETTLRARNVPSDSLGVLTTFAGTSSGIKGPVAPGAVLPEK
jgi:hypothetical protein